MGPAVDLKEVARKTPGFVGADGADPVVKISIIPRGMGTNYRDVALHVTRREPSAQWPWEGGSRDMAEGTRQYVDDEIARIIAERRARVDDLMAAHRGLLLRIARELVAVETVTGKRMRELAEAEAGPSAESQARLPVLIGIAPS